MTQENQVKRFLLQVQDIPSQDRVLIEESSRLALADSPLPTQPGQRLSIAGASAWVPYQVILLGCHGGLLWTIPIPAKGRGFLNTNRVIVHPESRIKKNTDGQLVYVGDPVVIAYGAREATLSQMTVGQDREYLYRAIPRRNYQRIAAESLARLDARGEQGRRDRDEIYEELDLRHRFARPHGLRRQRG